jgi:transcriptional regulator with XRE-family HTH domain
MLTKLKILRTQARMTLEELAGSTSLTRSYLSKLERGKAKPSIGTALRLATALGVSVESLFGQSAESDPIAIVRRSSSAPAPIPGLLSETRLVAGTAPRLDLLAFEERPPKAGTRTNQVSHHEGEELVYVLSGAITLTLADRAERLRKGDCAHFNATIPHQITSIDDRQASVLIVISRPRSKNDK